MKLPTTAKIVRTINKAQKYPDQLTREEVAIMQLAYMINEQNQKDEEGEKDVITKERKTK